jgi:NAD+ diphosphatase
MVACISGIFCLSIDYNLQSKYNCSDSNNLEIILSKRAFFFRGDTLLLPEDFSDSEIESGAPLELLKDFDNPDVFETPSLNNKFRVINTVSIPPETTLPANWKEIPVRRILTMFCTSNSDPCEIIRACHIAQWRQDSRYCGRCGTENCDAVENTKLPQLAATPFPYPPPLLTQILNTENPHRICPKCGKTEFPKICPAVIVMITDDQNKILLAHNKKFKPGLYSHISGFNDPGETLEETVVREIREEVNIEVKNIEYIKSQPWPFPNSLMIGFKARYLSGNLKPDGIEIKDAQWFTKDNLPLIPDEGSLSRYLINCWLSEECI